MALFLTLSPFVVLSLLLSVTAPIVALFSAAAAAFGLIVWDRYRGRSLKLLQAATLALLLAIGAYDLASEPGVSSHTVRLAFDAGLLSVTLASLALRFPFTIQYARENVDSEVAARPEFLRANYVLTWVWAAALALMLAANIGALYLAWLPLGTGLVAAFAARNSAAWFTQWYAARRRAAGEAARIARLRAMTGDVA